VSITKIDCARRAQRTEEVEASPVIAGLAKENKVKVVAGLHDIASGSVALLNER
jgi:hypothetical protein